MIGAIYIYVINQNDNKNYLLKTYFRKCCYSRVKRMINIFRLLCNEKLRILSRLINNVA